MWAYGGVVLALLVGMAIGAAAVTGVLAQGPPAAYAIIDVTEIIDPDAYGPILTRAPAGLLPLGGGLLLPGGKVHAPPRAAPQGHGVFPFRHLGGAQPCRGV